jgi:hypothetical protein
VYKNVSPVEALNEQAQKEDTLVPIRIDLEHEGYKLRDTFTWNLNGWYKSSSINHDKLSN